MSNRRFVYSKLRGKTHAEPTAHEVAHALNHVTAVIISTVELLGRATSSSLDRSLLSLLEHAAREVEELSSRVVGIVANSNPPAASSVPMVAPTEPAPERSSATEPRQIRGLSIEELAQSLSVRAMRAAAGSVARA
jgi:hypothetical protein